MIEITDVQIKLTGDSILRAFVTLTLNDSFAVRGLMLKHGAHGLFVVMPFRWRPDGQHVEDAGPLDEATRLYITRVVVEAYERKQLQAGAGVVQG
jgi:DNA-binding cell septation regulator SpoVG